ncbi:unnamed protein product [Symbiodinium microadriaticum]|nr:unnamed protein product [Symbiodinium microadriaticum]
MEDREPPEGGKESEPPEGGGESNHPEGGEAEEDEAEQERLYWEEENRRLERLEQQRLSQVEENPWCLLDEEEEEEEVREARKALVEEVERQRMLDYYDNRVSAAREQLLKPEEDSEAGSQVQVEVHLEMGPEWDMGPRNTWKHSEFAAAEDNPWQAVFESRHATIAEDRRRNKRSRPDDSPDKLPKPAFPRLQRAQGPREEARVEEARVPEEQGPRVAENRAAFPRLKPAEEPTEEPRVAEEPKKAEEPRAASSWEVAATSSWEAWSWDTGGWSWDTGGWSWDTGGWSGNRSGWSWDTASSSQDDPSQWKPPAGWDTASSWPDEESWGSWKSGTLSKEASASSKAKGGWMNKLVPLLSALKDEDRSSKTWREKTADVIVAVLNQDWAEATRLAEWYAGEKNMKELIELSRGIKRAHGMDSRLNYGEHLRRQ